MRKNEKHEKKLEKNEKNENEREKNPEKNDSLDIRKIKIN